MSDDTGCWPYLERNEKIYQKMIISPLLSRALYNEHAIIAYPDQHIKALNGKM